MSASLIGRLGSSAFRLSTTIAVSMSLAGSCFSNRPFGVKRFQTIHHHCGVDVARGLVLLFGIGTKALPSWDSKTRRNNLWGGLAVLQTVGPSGHTNSPHPSSREGHLHRSVELEFPPIAFDPARPLRRCNLPGPP